MNQREYDQWRHERNILAKLADKGVPLDSPDEDLRLAFAEVVAPTACFRLACEMRERAKMVQEQQAELL